MLLWCWMVGHDFDFKMFRTQAIYYDDCSTPVRNVQYYCKRCKRARDL